MEQSKFSFQLTPTNPTAGLGFEVWLNDQCVFDTDHVAQSLTITGDLPNDSVETEHTLKMVLKHKQAEHTKINDTGDITQDACLEIFNWTFNGVELGPLVSHLTVYEHDFNSNSEKIKDKFFGTMGCNGTVELKFSTPIYLWLLGHM
jgi:hypothetical protein